MPLENRAMNDLLQRKVFHDKVILERILVFFLQVDL